MKWDNNKLKSLYENLDFNLNQSIYKNALPIYHNRLDIAGASYLDGFGSDFINSLLNKVQFEHEFQIKTEFNAHMNHIYLEYHNAKLDKNFHTLSVGFPLFIDKDKEFSLLPIVSPIFIWSVDIKPSVNRPDTWIMSKSDTKPRLNPFLYSYLKEKRGVDIDSMSNEYIEKYLEGTKSLNAFCNELAKKLNIDNSLSLSSVIPCPNTNEIKEMSDTATFFNAAILGIYGQEHSNLKEYLYEKMQDEDSTSMLTSESIEKEFRHPFSLTAPDPCQKHLTFKMQNQKITIAEGSNGTGKSTAVYHLATNILANGLSCLVVSPYSKGLKGLESKLKKDNIHALSYIFTDSKNEIQSFYNHHKKYPEYLEQLQTTKRYGYEVLLERCINRHEQMEEHHQLLSKRAFGNLDFTDTVGYYIDSNRLSGKDILSGRLNAKDYKFTFREHDIIKTDLIKGERLFKKIKKLNHPLTVLHEEIFLNKEIERATEFTNKNVKSYKSKTDQLLRRFTKTLEEYRDELRNHYESHARDLYGKIRGLKSKINEYSKVYGEDFKQSGLTKVQMYGIFSENYSNIKAARKEVTHDFHDIENIFNEKKYFDYRFPKTKDVEKITTIQQFVNDFESVLEQWINNLPFGIIKESNTMNSKSVMMHMDYSAVIGDLEYSHDLLLEELNQTKLFREWFSYEGRSIKKRIENIEQLWTLLEITDQNLPQFEDFYPWQKHWLEILPLSKETIKGIHKSKAAEWLPAFNSWYFYSCLNDYSFMSFNINENVKEEYLKDLASLRSHMPDYIKDLWAVRQEKSLLDLEEKNKKLFDLFFGKKSTLPSNVRIKDVFLTFHKELPVWYPITMMTYEVAEELLTPSKIHYDVLILDDAHKLSMTQAIPLMDIADRVVVIGDRQQSLYVSEDKKTLINELVESGADIIPFYYQHEDCEKSCIDFANATAYHGNIKKISYFLPENRMDGIQLKNVSGRYDEEKKVNEFEAEYLIGLLGEVKMNPHTNKFPKTAIVTNTFAQRDLIHNYIIYAKQKRNPVSEMIIKLEEEGLRIVHFSELNDHYDNIVWSMTFGTINLKSQLAADFYQFESTVADRALNIILSKVKNKLILCSSIPMNFVDEKLKNNAKAAHSVIQFLKYAQIVEQKNNKIRTEFLQEIKWEGLRTNEREPFNFIQQVKKELEPYFEKDRLKITSPLEEIGTAALTLLPQDHRQPIPLVIGDSIDRNNPTVAYEFEDAVLKKLEEAGYQIYQIHSYSWWKNPKREARILAGKLIKADNTPVKTELNSVK